MTDHPYTPYPTEPRWFLYHDGAWHVPYRVTPEGRPAWSEHRRILIDWNDPFDAPRRFHYFGLKYTLVVALTPNARSQKYSWRKREWTDKWGWVKLSPSRQAQ